MDKTNIEAKLNPLKYLLTKVKMQEENSPERARKRQLDHQSSTFKTSSLEARLMLRRFTARQCYHGNAVCISQRAIPRCLAVSWNSGRQFITWSCLEKHFSGAAPWKTVQPKLWTGRHLPVNSVTNNPSTTFLFVDFSSWRWQAISLHVSQN